MANLGPLTTTYTAISSISCGSIHLATDTEGFWLEQANRFEDCFPPNFTALNGYYYSPGVCQDGYTYACNTTTGRFGTTVATCCPSGFTCRSTRSDNDNDACQSILRSDSPYIGNVITYHGGRSKDIGTTSTLIEAGEIVYAIGVPVRRAATDAEWSITSTNLDITATQMRTPTISTESTPESSGSVRPTTKTITLGTQDPGSPSSGTATQTSLGTAAKVAIGVGTVLGVLIFLLGTAVIYHKRKRKWCTPTSPSSLREPADTERKPSGPILGHELEEQRGVYEMNADREPSELTAVREPVELN
ncbi:hypothetical protein FHL15_005535 [Xylaria flabelliformis]|uniref:Uncharacterized protein n=1 Tax=Xylaria flabelliformis TaxID=2512241 RepID=A0A553I036_9PEZI|nr:hypothetical protein FHL15_005535 [Xylaria flabelliformis]